MAKQPRKRLAGHGEAGAKIAEFCGWCHAVASRFKNFPLIIGTPHAQAMPGTTAHGTKNGSRSSRARSLAMCSQVYPSGKV
jgi:hypothetical protein